MSSRMSYRPSGARLLRSFPVRFSRWRRVAYTIGDPFMQPVTKITVLGVRLAIVALVFYWLLMFTGTHLAASTLEVADSLAPKVSDKVKHFAAFFLLGTLLCYVTNSDRWLRRFFSIGLVGMLYAGIDEYTQRFVPGRYPDFYDFVADSLGLWTAIIAYMLAKVLFGSWESRFRAKLTGQASSGGGNSINKIIN